MDLYKQKEYDLRNLIDTALSLPSTFEDYVQETESFIDKLIEETKEFNIIKSKNKDLEAEVQQLKEQLTREVEIRDDIYTAAHYKWNMLKQRIGNYSFNNEPHVDGQYYPTISVMNLLKLMMV